MSWFDILKEIKVEPEENLEHLEEWVRAEEKGYPSIIHPLKVVANYNDETGKLDAYTSYKDFGKFAFVGNGGNLNPNNIRGWGDAVKHRNTTVGKNKPKITLLNPKGKTTLESMVTRVERFGGIKINSFSQVDDIMDENTYQSLNTLPMFRYPPLKKGE
tara:strand:+ start:619 stop:1095 length:477 start_codon:yes stop_codon:yes gene_type:complete